jgi:hypothetical protein
MGISAAGYLGGKVVRLPGPVIQQLLVSAAPLTRDAQGKEQPVKLTIDMKGENLSTDAVIKIDGVQLRPKDEFTIVEVKPQNAPADPSFRAEVNVVLIRRPAQIYAVNNIAISLIDRVLSVNAWLRQLRLCRTEASHPVQILRGILFWEAKRGL